MHTILRHTDRAREFAGATFAKWCSARGIMHTMSPGDEQTQNARVERSIGILKNRVRTLIRASGAQMSWWPLALRHAGESILRDQLWQLGIATLASLWGPLEVSWNTSTYLGSGV